MSLIKVKSELVSVSDAERAKNYSHFFKTGEGDYGEGDKFLGIKVPDQRKIAKRYYKSLDFLDLRKLMESKYHEHRLTGVFILVYKFQSGEKKECFDFYLDNIKRINNWDLVDSSAPQIIGKYLLDKPGIHRKFLYNYARSGDLWLRRISILSTLAFIKDGQFDDTLKISEVLLNDKHDLIHKAVGWMLREIGNIDKKIETEFLEKHAHEMPRTMLRYAIEKFSERERKYFMTAK